jgi:NTP pyrophosphatase (non-canonical NTP hydrolase)
MDLEEMSERAGQVRRRFAEFETRTHGAEWTIDDLVLGLVTDVGDLAAAVQRVEGRRPGTGTDPRHALRHELSDCLWSILVIARHFDVDLAEAFPATMDDIDDWLDRQP